MTASENRGGKIKKIYAVRRARPLYNTTRRLIPAENRRGIGSARDHWIRRGMVKTNAREHVFSYQRFQFTTQMVDSAGDCLNSAGDH